MPSMMIGVACSFDVVSTRIRPSTGSVMSSSAGSDIADHLLLGRMTLGAWGFGCRSGEEWCERRDFVGRTLDADDRWAVDGQRRSHCDGQVIAVGDVDGHQPGKHRREARPEGAGCESVVAVEVVVEELF